MGEKKPATTEELIALAYEHFGWLLTLPEITRIVEDARTFPDLLPLKADRRFTDSTIILKSLPNGSYQTRSERSGNS